MKRIPTDLLAKYLANPLGTDEEVRKALDLPADRYYTVSTWPEEHAGKVYVLRLSREVKNKKISKSDQKT